MKQFYVYIHKKPDGTPFYVGKGYERRAYRFSNRNQWHQNIVAKYGKHNIIIEIINCTSESQAFDLEKIYIKQFKEIDGYSLVNMSDGGEGNTGRVFTAEHRQKISEASKGKPKSEAHKLALCGKTMTEKQRKQIVDRQKGSKASAETKQKLSAIRTGKKLSAESKRKISEKHLGKKLTEDHRKKLSESHKGHKHTEETKAKMKLSHTLRLQNKKNVI